MATTPLAVHLIPGSASVAVSNKMCKKVGDLQPGETILMMDIAAGNIFMWATLQRIEVVHDHSMPQNSIIVGFGGDDSVSLRADQVVLAKDRKKKKIIMQKVSRLDVGFHSVVSFNVDDLQKPHFKKISSLEVVRENDASEGLYKLTVGTTNHSLLMSCDEDVRCFLVVDSSNSNMDLKDTARFSEHQVEIKNTFIVVKEEFEKEKGKVRHELHGGYSGMSQSYSDTDLHGLAVALNMDEACASPAFIRVNDRILAASSTGVSTESRSNDTSSALKSEVSSMSEGSITAVRLGTRSFLDEDGRQRSTGSHEIHLTDFSKLPVNEFGVRLSAASLNHKPGRKAKCNTCMNYTAFSFKRGIVCNNGALCDFCHGPHDRFIHRR